MRWFALVMSIAYFAIGAMLVFTPMANDFITVYRPAIGGFLMAYGAFRGFMWYRRGKAQPEA
ncbi:MAG TPA: hypothetical protein PK760_01585 [Flavobacteriales bacterium]|nr:hypothetical protein [Flavobacteriales bacterium]